jgi:hypothetical protein
MELAVTNLKQYILEYMLKQEKVHFMNERQMFNILLTLVNTLISIKLKDPKI